MSTQFSLFCTFFDWVIFSSFPLELYNGGTREILEWRIWLEFSPVRIIRSKCMNRISSAKPGYVYPLILSSYLVLAHVATHTLISHTQTHALEHYAYRHTISQNMYWARHTLIHTLIYLKVSICALEYGRHRSCKITSKSPIIWRQRFLNFSTYRAACSSENNPLIETFKIVFTTRI